MKKQLYLTAYNIDWETDGEKVKLPDKIILPDCIVIDWHLNDQDDDIVTDYLSDEYGWLVNSYELDYLSC
jgi:hypothetical protein